MKDKIKCAYFFISLIRLIPHLVIFNISGNRKIIKYDSERWLHILNINMRGQIGFLYLMTFFPEFRNLFYYRSGFYSKPFAFLCPKMGTLYIDSKDIGPGLFIQHGFATIIAAKRIGKDCWINQQVTVGFSNATDCPTISDNVTISAGAKIIGAVTVGTNSKVGANAVVIKDVPEDCTVVGVPANIIKRNGVRVEEKLSLN